ncbi:MAG: glycosyltransferase family 4 protein [bacterium]|nr:glycosyltransferase family 4 protein [bacterium]
MKIAIFTDTCYPQINGVVTSTQTLAAKLEDMGHTVLIVGPKMKGAEESTDKIWRFRSVVFPFQKEHRMVSPVSRKLKQFKELNFDVIHVQTPIFLGHLGQYMSWYHRIPLVHTYHTFWAEYLHYFPVLPKRLRVHADMLVLSRNFCNRCQHVIVPSSQMKDKLLEYEISTPMSVIPTGVEIYKSEIDEIKKEKFRKQYKITKDHKTCIFVGRLGLEKNIYFLLDSFKMVLEKINDVKLLIIGDGPEKDLMKKYAEKTGISNNIIFTGYMDHQDVFTAYASVDVITFPSKTETQGLSLLEGLSLGKPAVCINAMGVKDIIKNEKGGYLTQDNVIDYSRKVILLLQDPEIYQQKSMEARGTAELFSADSMAEKTLEVYKKAIALRKEGNTIRKLSLSGFFKGPFAKFFISRSKYEDID